MVINMCDLISECSECVRSCYWTALSIVKCAYHGSLQNLDSDLVSFLRPGSSCEGFHELHCGSNTSTVPPLVATGNTGMIFIILAFMLILMLMDIVWLFPVSSKRLRTRFHGYVNAVWQGVCSEMVRIRQTLPAAPFRRPSQQPPPPPPPPSPVRPARFQRSRIIPTPVQVSSFPNPADFRLDQALEQQRQIISRFRDLEAWLQQLEGMVDWLQNRLLELQNVLKRQQQQPQLVPSLQTRPSVPTPPPLYPAPPPPPPFRPATPSQAQIRPAPQPPPQLNPAPAPLPPISPAPPPPLQPSPSTRLRLQQEQQLLTGDEDDVSPPRFRPCRMAKRAHPCYLCDTVSSLVKKTWDLKIGNPENTSIVSSKKIREFHSLVFEHFNKKYCSARFDNTEEFWFKELQQTVMDYIVVLGDDSLNAAKCPLPAADSSVIPTNRIQVSDVVTDNNFQDIKRQVERRKRSSMERKVKTFQCKDCKQSCVHQKHLVKHRYSLHRSIKINIADEIRSSTSSKGQRNSAHDQPDNSTLLNISLNESDVQCEKPASTKGQNFVTGSF
ncbi:unnamed protein product [Allacma fusca]|uniref:C2H2-type domain-containing protein n=1 Tax=Allacma fusca TaxID=39272 RepID=A0A8J2LDX7_9HEXA|nr:unnamed protein product [Allacma fusca]